jgi:hypothetical protein
MPRYTLQIKMKSNIKHIFHSIKSCERRPTDVEKEESWAGNKSNFSTFASRKRQRDGKDIIPKPGRFFP